jgi:tetrahydromethanopterin S-methyltransferase subunit B
MMARFVQLNGLLDVRSAIAGMLDNVKSMSSDTNRIEVHAKHLDSIDERLDRIVALMERMVSSIDELSARVEGMQEAVEPVGRLANRFPGRAKR